MSFDVYLLPLQHDDNLETAMALLESLENNDADYAYELDARDAVDTVLAMNRRYTRFQLEAEERNKYENSPAGLEYLSILDNSIQLTGQNDAGRPMAQFHFYRYHIVIHCYDGTSADEHDQFVIALCSATGLAAVDPQEGKVWRILEDGTLG